MALDKPLQGLAVAGLGARTLGHCSHFFNRLRVLRGCRPAQLAAPGQAHSDQMLAKVAILRVWTVAFAIKFVVSVNADPHLVSLRALHHGAERGLFARLQLRGVQFFNGAAAGIGLATHKHRCAAQTPQRVVGQQGQPSGADRATCHEDSVSKTALALIQQAQAATNK